MIYPTTDLDFLFGIIVSFDLGFYFLKPSHNLFVNAIIPTLLLPKQGMYCTQLHVHVCIFYFHSFKSKSVTIMCFMNTWTRVSPHSVIWSQNVWIMILKQKGFQKSCTNYETKGKTKKIKCHIAVSNPHSKNSVCIERNSPIPIILGHRAIDITERYNLYSTSEPDQMVASNQREI